MMTRQLSTSVSDGVLAFATFHSAYRLLGFSMYGALGFFIIAIAASLGTARFASAQPSRPLVVQHDYMSWVSRVLGISCLTTAYYRQAGVAVAANIHLAAALALVILNRHLAEKTQRIATEVVSTAAVVSTLGYSLLRFNPYCMVGMLLYVVSGTVVKTEGYMWEIPRVDIFHYALAVANIALMMGLSQPTQPLYYTPS